MILYLQSATAQQGRTGIRSVPAKEAMLLFTPCSSTCCLDKAKECGLPSIQPFAKGELSMSWMLLRFAAVLLFGQV